MRLGLFLTTLSGLAGAAHVSSAADASWVAVPESKNLSAWCGVRGPSWHVVIKGNTLTFTSQSTKRSDIVDLKALQPDGSGTSAISHCRTAFTPRT